jgi:YaiO family outer membrane protein
LAEKQDYSAAIQLMEELSLKYPGNKDFSTYLARLYFWNNSPEKAEEILTRRKADELNHEELDLLIQVDNKLLKPTEMLILSDMGMNRFPEVKDHYLYTKAMAFVLLNDDEAALELLAQIPKDSPQYNAADYLRTEILKRQKNTLSAGYLLTTFDETVFDPQQIAFVEYGRKFKTGTHLFRVNYADMFGKQAVQFETDAYIKVKASNYIYANLGVSDKLSVFPQLRAGFEFYREEKHFSASLGTRYLYFDKGSDPVLLTGHLAYNTSNGWTANYRPFVSFLDSKTLASHLVYFRKALPNKESYVQLDMQYGNLPYFYLTSDLLSRLEAYRIGINTRFRVNYNWFVQPVFMYEYEEYIPKMYRNRYTFQLILSHRF